EEERAKHVEERIHEMAWAPVALGEERVDGARGVVPAARLVVEFDALSALPADSAVDAEPFGCCERFLVELEGARHLAVRVDMRARVAVPADDALGEADLGSELDAAHEIGLEIRISEIPARHPAVVERADLEVDEP